MRKIALAAALGLAIAASSSSSVIAATAPLSISVTVSPPTCSGSNPTRDAIFSPVFTAHFPAGFDRRIVVGAKIQTNSNPAVTTTLQPIVLSPSAPTAKSPILLILKTANPNQTRGIALVTVQSVFSIPLTGPLPPQWEYNNLGAVPQLENGQTAFNC